MNPAPGPLRLRPFSVRGVPGSGKAVAVFLDAEGDLQARAAEAGAPLSAFVTGPWDSGEVSLRVFTPTREKGESDSAALAALSALGERLGDWAEVRMGAETTPAQLCGGEWLLSQGAPTVAEAPLPSFPGLAPLAAQVAGTGRPNLLLEVADVAALEAFAPDEPALRALGEATGTTGLVLYARQAPSGSAGALARADLSFRAFGPLRGFLEDAASSNMAASLVAGLGARGLWPADAQVLRLAQRRPGQPALLTAQFSEVGGPVWIGGQTAAETP